MTREEVIIKLIEYLKQWEGHPNKRAMAEEVLKIVSFLEQEKEK